MFVVVLIAFLMALLAPLVVRYCRGYKVGWWLALIPLAFFIYFIRFITPITHNEVIYSGLTWIPQWGIDFSFALDGLSFLFVLLITGIGIPIVIYSASYLDKHPYLMRYYGYLFLFFASMLGLVLADNLITLFIFWELTSISSYLLIGIEHERIVAREAAAQALFVTVLGGLSLLASFILMGMATHTYSLSQMLSQEGLLQHHPWLSIILLLLFLGAFSKSAQFPFHFWLASAMEAPTPVSAYLHSATMVQAGVYLLARFHPLLSHNAWWFITLTTVGSITMIVGVLLAVRENDMKLMLAYTTVTALGSLIFLLGSTQDTVIKAAVAFLVAHALYKATLFMAIGDIQHQAGTRDIREVRGLHKAMPITFMAVLVAGASMAGLPPLLGFYVKELVYEANLAEPIAAHFLVGIAVISNMLMAMLAFMLVLRPFWGRQKPERIREANVNMSLNALLLASLSLALSLFPFVLNRTLLSPAASTILSHPVSIELTLWHGLTPSLALSLITVLGAIVLYLKRAWLQWLLDRCSYVFDHGALWVYQQTLRGLLWWAREQTRWLQSGKLRFYLTMTFATMAVLLFLGILKQPLRMIIWQGVSLDFFTLFLVLWIFLSALAVIGVRHYLTGLIFLAVFGAGITLFFLTQAAPDVAMTQMLVETLIIIIVVLNLYRQPLLPKISGENRTTCILNATIALIVGFSMSVLLLMITQQPFYEGISQYFIKHSVSLGNGRNIVNVILIDFRAFDTLGEIIVVAVSAIGIYGLLKSRFEQEE